MYSFNARGSVGGVLSYQVNGEQKSASRDAYGPIETAGIGELRALHSSASAGHCVMPTKTWRTAGRASMQPESAPESLRSLEDLRLFPFTTKRHLRDNYPFGMFAVPREQVVRIHASSGTTGKPTVVGYTQRDIDVWTALVARSIYAAGGRAGDLVHAAYGYGLFTGGLGAHYGGERLGCTVIPVSGGLTAGRYS